MAVPKKKTSPSRRGMRRSADALKRPAYVEDKDSGELRRPHHIDLKTGIYRGRQVLTKKAEESIASPRPASCSDAHGCAGRWNVTCVSAYSRLFCFSF